jgi:hypothetical protein
MSGEQSRRQEKSIFSAALRNRGQVKSQGSALRALKEEHHTEGTEVTEVRSKIDQKSKPHRRKLHFSPGGLANRRRGGPKGESKRGQSTNLDRRSDSRERLDVRCRKRGQVDCGESRSPTLSSRIGLAGSALKICCQIGNASLYWPRPKPKLKTNLQPNTGHRI